MYADTFYVFSCKVRTFLSSNLSLFNFFSSKVCNHGREFIHRLKMTWKELVHLVLYKFSEEKPQKYFSVTKDLAPFLQDNWEKLNLSLTVSMRIGQ
jgi:hypothetical protein